MKQSVDNNYLLGNIPHDVYFANPLGFTESGRILVQEKILPSLVNGGVATYEPFREFFARATEKYGKFDLSQREIVLFGATANALAIQKCSLVLAVLDGVDVDSGTASEIWYATGIWKPIIGVRTDFRWNSADGVAVKVNLQVEWFITMSWGVIYSTYADAISATIEHILNLRK